MRPRLAIPLHALLRFEPFKQLLYGRIQSGGSIGIQPLGQLAHRGRLQFPKRLQDSQLGISNILRSAGHLAAQHF